MDFFMKNYGQHNKEVFIESEKSTCSGHRNFQRVGISKADDIVIQTVCGKDVHKNLEVYNRILKEWKGDE